MVQKNKHRKKPEIVLKTDNDDQQEYAQVVKMLGDSRLEAKCMDGVNRQCRIRGIFRDKRNWIQVGDMILLGLRDYQDSKADVIFKYTSSQARFLQKNGYIPDTLKLDGGGNNNRHRHGDRDDIDRNDNSNDTDDDNDNIVFVVDDSDECTNGGTATKGGTTKGGGGDNNKQKQIVVEDQPARDFTLADL